MTSPTLNSLTKFWWVPIGLLVGWFLLRQHDAVVRYRAVAEVRLDSLRAVTSVLDSLKESAARKDSLVAAQRRRIEDEQEIRQKQIDDVKKTTARAVDELRVTLTQEQRQQLDSVVAGYENQAKLYQDQIKASAKLIMSLDTVIARKDSLLGGYQQANSELLKKYAEMVDKTKPTVGQSLSKWIPWIVAGAAILSR